MSLGTSFTLIYKKGSNKEHKENIPQIFLLRLPPHQPPQKLPRRITIRRHAELRLHLANVVAQIEVDHALRVADLETKFLQRDLQLHAFLARERLVGPPRPHPQGGGG